MNSRMSKYDGTPKVSGRLEKNKKLYDEVQDMNIDYIDINVDNAIELDPYGNDKKTRSDYQKQRELDKIISNNSEKERIELEDETVKEEKIYDINEILRLAKENKLFDEDKKKRLINTEYNILTKLDIEELDKEENMSKENLKDLIDKVYENEKKVEPEDDTDLFTELIETNEEKEEREKAEKIELTPAVSKDILDESTIIEEVEENTEEQEKSYDTEPGTTTDLNIEINRSNSSIVVIVILILIVLGIIGYLLYKYFSA